MASRSDRGKSGTAGDPGELENEFLSRFEEEQKPYALELLDLARASYRLRDDDNIYLGKIEGQFLAALEEGNMRIEKGTMSQSKPGETIRRFMNVVDKLPPSENLPDETFFAFQRQPHAGHLRDDTGRHEPLNIHKG